MAAIHLWTIFGHFIFFTLMSFYEFVAPRKAADGLIQPMKKLPQSSEQIINEIDGNIAFKLVFFGLKKYHLLFGVSCFIIWFTDPSTEAQQYALLILGINFLMDDIWAATYSPYLQNIGILVPQWLFATYDISLFFVTSPPQDSNVAVTVCVPLAITTSLIGVAVIYGNCRKDIKEQRVQGTDNEDERMM